MPASPFAPAVMSELVLTLVGSVRLWEYCMENAENVHDVATKSILRSPKL